MHALASVISCHGEHVVVVVVMVLACLPHDGDSGTHDFVEEPKRPY